MKLIVGLGNPGFRYRATRHNIGFMVLDKLASDFKIRIKGRAFNSLLARGGTEDQEVILAKPLTYMNLSGKAVSLIKENEDIPLEDILIIMDDADLPLGKIRLKKKGSSGGHKGLGSIIEELGSEEIARLRVGIAGVGRRSAALLSDYVLTPFKRSEKNDLAAAVHRCNECVTTWIRDGIESAMSRFNT